MKSEFEKFLSCYSSDVVTMWLTGCPGKYDEDEVSESLTKMILEGYFEDVSCPACDIDDKSKKEHFQSNAIWYS